MRSRFPALAALGALAILVSCSDGPTGPVGQDLVPLRVSANVAGTPVSILTITVTAADIATPLVFNLHVAGGMATGTVNVSPGPARTFTARAFDSLGQVTHEGSATVDVLRGPNPPLTIPMVPRAGHVPITVTVAEVSVVLVPAFMELMPGETWRPTVLITDAQGQPLEGAVPTWASANPAFAVVDGTGLVTAVAVGQTQIVAVFGGVAGLMWVQVGDGLGFGFGPEQFALIPAGTFTMGDDDSGYGNESPAHEVTITQPFMIQKTEVTQGQWEAVMGENPSYFSACGDLCPVERVSWDDIQDFLTALNAMDPGKNYRLPTEAEWEYAARAGTTGDYGGTGVLDEMGWYDNNSGGTTHPVALKQPNYWGLYDMHGNVWEWVQDWHSATYYQYKVDHGIVNDPPGPETGSSRVLRGGSWSGFASHARSAFRSYGTPDTGFVNVGFRLARTP
jgi:hypothetical protein